MQIKPRVMDDFEGRWSLERRIIHREGPEARFVGEAVWLRVGAVLEYTEIGNLQIAGTPPIRATRRYTWHPDLSVTFEDGRYFHTVPATGGRTAHWCDPDQYDVIYDFGEWPHFRTEWVVEGPRKKYRMISQFQPLSP